MAIIDIAKTAGASLMARAKEPSTWAAGGIGALSVHTILPGVLGDATLSWLVATSVLLATALPERKA